MRELEGVHSRDYDREKWSVFYVLEILEGTFPWEEALEIFSV